MSGDIATISLRVNTSDVERGSNELDKFAEAAAVAAKGADNFGTSGKGAAKVSAEVAREVEDTHQRVRRFSEALKQNETSIKGAAQATAQQQQELRTLLTQINPVTAAFEKLDNMEQQLSRFNAKGLVDTDTFRDATRTIQQTREELGRTADARTTEGRAAAAAAQQDKAATAAREGFLRKLKEQVATQNLSKQELLQYKAAQLGVGSAADVYIKKINSAEEAVHSFSLQSSAARRELGVMLGELARGNLGALRGSSITLANRSGLIDQLFSLKGLAIGGTIGAATAALIGLYKVYETAEKESSAFNKSVILTGEYSGLTAKQLANMADSVGKSVGTVGEASEVLSKLAGAGVSSAVNFKEATAAIVEFSHYSGQSIDDLVKQFAQLSDDPSGGSLALTKNLHYLTAAQYQHISALQEEGDKAGAVTAATDALSGAMERRAKEIKESMGTLPSFFDEVGKSASKMWDGIMGLGRDPSDAERRAKLTLKIKSAENDPRRYNGGTPSLSDADLDAAKKELAALDAVQQKKTNTAKVDQDAIDAQQGLNKLIKEGLTPAEKRLAVEKDLSKWIESNKKAHAEDAKVQLFTDAQIAKARAGIENQYKDPKIPKGVTKAYQDDAGTRELLASQQRLAALKDQVSASATLTSQEQQLSKFTQQIADLKSKTILTADQKSLLARAGEITASLQLEAQLSRENVQREKAVKALKQMQDYTTSIVSKNAQTQEKFGLTTKQAGRVDQETQLNNTFRKQTDGITDPAALSKVTEEYNRAKEALRSGWDQEDANQGDWLAGMNQGIAQFGENASDVFTATGQLAQTTLSDMSSMMSTLATTGKANVKDFAKSFLTSIVEIINKLLIAQAVQAAMGWISSSFSAGSGTATAASNSSFSSGAYNGLSFDSGGYTGEGDKFAPAGIVHRGEFVMTKEATSRIGVDNLYSMMRGYADGGLVGGNAGMFGLSGGQSNSTVVQTSVVVQTGNNQQQTSGNSDAIGKAYQQVIDQSVRDGIAKALRPGGLIYNANNSR